MPRYRIDDPDAAHYLTFSCHQRRLLFLNPTLCYLFLEKLHDARTKLNFQLLAYVIMPNHVHLLLLPGSIPMKKIMYHVKQPFSYHAGLYYKENYPRLHRALSVKRGLKWSFRFWLAGGGFDRLLYTNDDIQKRIRYTHRNPLRWGITENPEMYPWSSFHAYSNKSGKPIPVDRPVWL
ncbi:transposase [bacterium]|nr:transposase [bacterium]